MKINTILKRMIVTTIVLGSVALSCSANVDLPRLRTLFAEGGEFGIQMIKKGGMRIPLVNKYPGKEDLSAILSKFEDMKIS